MYNLEISIKSPKLVERKIERKWWFNKIEYWIEFEYGDVGPFRNHKEAHKYLKIYTNIICK